MNAITRFDFSILDYIQNHIRCGFLDAVMPRVTFLGDGGLIWIALALIFLILKKHRKKGVMMAAALICGMIICNILLKNIIGRQRPCWINENINMLVDIPRDYSFPSGHTLASFESSAVLLFCSRKAGAAALVLSVLIAFSRLYLYVHFPTDVLAGAVIGTIIGIAVCAAANKISFARTADKI